MRRLLFVCVLVLLALPCFAQQGQGNDCTIAGTWYGGSVVAYKMTIIPINPSGHFMVITEPGFTGALKETSYSEIIIKNGDRYEGTGMQFMSNNPALATPPPTPGVMPDLRVYWGYMKLTDCNTITNVIPFFGIYFADGVWSGHTVPFQSPLDVDLVNVLNAGKPVLETYHRLPLTIDPKLIIHK